jgi:PPK2 family polyphosphate:nucleotide phosphotransferase
MSETRQERILRVGEPLRVAPGTTVGLAEDFDPADTVGVKGKKQGKKLLKAAVNVISDYQLRLAAEERHGVLVVVQALDAGGKDGTIRHVLSGVNPAGVAVQSFKQPSEQDLAHEFLWRYEKHLPAPGQIAVFNRSHYEEVLVVRVHPELLEAEQTSAPTDGGGDVWQQRFDQINEWERDLADHGIRIVKLLLNISNEEQRIRFLRRCDLPEKHWKFSASDIRNASTGTSTSTPSPRCSPTPARSGRPGTLSRPTTNGSLAWRPRRCSWAPSCASTPRSPRSTPRPVRRSLQPGPNSKPKRPVTNRPTRSPRTPTITARADAVA